MDGSQVGPLMIFGVTGSDDLGLFLISWGPFTMLQIPRTQHVPGIENAALAPS
jgi:hypothetical protein